MKYDQYGNMLPNSRSRISHSYAARRKIRVRSNVALTAKYRVNDVLAGQIAAAMIGASASRRPGRARVLVRP